MVIFPQIFPQPVNVQFSQLVCYYHRQPLAPPSLSYLYALILQSGQLRSSLTREGPRCELTPLCLFLRMCLSGKCPIHDIYILVQALCIVTPGRSPQFFSLSRHQLIPLPQQRLFISVGMGGIVGLKADLATVSLVSLCSHSLNEFVGRCDLGHGAGRLKKVVGEPSKVNFYFVVRPVFMGKRLLPDWQ